MQVILQQLNMPVLPDVYPVNDKNISWLGYMLFCETWYTNRQTVQLSRQTPVTTSHPKHRWMKFASLSRTLYRARRARQTVELLRSRHVATPTARTLIRLITAFGDWCRNESINAITGRCYGGWWARGLNKLPAECSKRSNWLVAYTRISFLTAAAT